MRFSEWEPTYEAILTDFGYAREADEAARDLLAGLVDRFDLDRLDLAGTVAVVAPGPSLSAERGRLSDADSVVAASAAADAVDPDLMVTDLDGNPETAVELTHAGTPVAVHAHGDNRDALREFVPRMNGEWVLATTQAEPRGPVVNFGGFTDGDRAAFLADELGAAELLFVGWDLDDPSVGDEKRRKLRWAARLLRMLETSRGERFDVLDGLRDHLD